MCTKEDYKDFHFTGHRHEMLTHELEAWHKEYLPIKHGGTVLDVGAGEGETMVFYLLHGAKRVICVEADPDKAKVLQKNANIAEKKFKAKVDLIESWLDNIKIDIDGGEENMVIEKHFAGYWKEVGKSKGFPAAAKVYKLKKRKWLDNLLLAKELLVIRLKEPKEIYEKAKAKNRRN